MDDGLPGIDCTDQRSIALINIRFTGACNPQSSVNGRDSEESTHGKPRLSTQLRMCNKGGTRAPPSEGETDLYIRSTTCKPGK